MSRVAPAVRLRPALPSDAQFLRHLYASVRAPEFAAVQLDAIALERLLEMQFNAQSESYRRGHPNANDDLVIVAEKPAGRLYVDPGPATIHVLDISLLPNYRGQGIGTRLLEGLLAQGRSLGRPVTLQALRTSRALALYRRLGFTETGGDGVYLELECPPSGVS